ncbi:MAG: hypothetical protein ACYC9O_06510, partial [Candidatus Latescibacterota bacterium]
SAQQRGPDVEVSMYKGKPVVFLDGKPDALPGYSPGPTKEYYDKYMHLFYQHKMGVYPVWIDRLPEDYNSTRWWLEDKVSAIPLVKTSEKVFSLDDQAGHILKGDPDGRILIRFYTRAPKSWAEKHPNEFTITEEGKVQDTPSLASDLFWEHAAEFGAALVRYCEAQPWGNRVIGYNTHYLEEGAHLPVADGWMFDHNPLMTQKYRDFLRKKYGTAQKLRAAWNDTTLTFETVTVPKDRLRGPVPEVSGIPYWQNAKDNQPLRDYLELTRDLFHLRFRQCGEAMEKAVNRKVLILHDALKQVMLGWNLKGFFGYPGFGQTVSWNLAYPELMAGSGHMNAARLFDSPGFSGILTPHDYQARGIGGVYEPEGMADSAVLRGKPFWAEMDTRSGDKDIGTARNYQEWEAITWRNFATGWTRGFNSYWMYGFFIADWFGDKPVQDVIHRQTELIRQSVEWPHETMPGIAMILDDASVLETNGAGNFLNEAVMWEQKMGIARSGVPHNIYVFEDLELENFPKHRVYYFPNLFRVDDKRLEILKKKVFRDGAVVVWGPGSGISDGKKIGIESAKKLTGFDFEMLPANAPRRILISNFEHPVTHGLDADLVIGGPLSYGPILLPKNCTELGLAWAKGGNNHIGLGLKEFGKGAALSPAGITTRGEGDYAAVFTTAANLPANLWRNLARYAGAHVYCESNDVFLADNSVVALHSLKSERKRIALQGKYKVTDLVTGKLYSKGASEIRFDLQGPETKVYLLEK